LTFSELSSTKWLKGVPKELKPFSSYSLKKSLKSGAYSFISVATMSISWLFCPSSKNFLAIFKAVSTSSVLLKTSFDGFISFGFLSCFG